MELKLDKIRIDGETQARVEISEDVVRDYADGLADGFPFPNIVVFNDGTTYWLADGFHRVHGARRAGLQTIAADVIPGTQADARWYAAGANRTHGLRRTNADKRKAVEIALGMRPELSDRAIAEHCGVSHTFVQNMREQLATVASSDGPRTGLDGKTRALPVQPERPIPPDPPGPVKVECKLPITPELLGNLARYLIGQKPPPGDLPCPDGTALSVIEEPAGTMVIMAWVDVDKVRYQGNKAPRDRVDRSVRALLRGTPPGPVQVPNATGTPPPQVGTDNVGQRIPPEVLDLWNRSQDEGQELLTIVSQLRTRIRKAQDDQDPLYLEVNFSHVLAHLDQVYAGLGVVKGHAVCPSCHGLIGCRLCNKRGILSKFRWDKTVPEEQKQQAAGADEKPANAPTALDDADWRNARKILALYEMNPLHLDPDGKRIWGVDDMDGQVLALEYEGKTKAETEREWKAMLAMDAYDMKRPGTMPGMISCRKRSPVGGTGGWTIYAVGQAPPAPSGWSLMMDQDNGNAVCRYGTEEERDAAWQRLVVLNPKALEG